MPVIEYSFVLAGNYSVGKSSIFQRLKTGKVPEGVTRGMTSASSWDNDDGGLDSFVYEKEIDGRKIKVTVWDTGGQERYESMTANYYRSAHAVILVYAVDEEGTLYGLNESVGVAKDTSRQGDNLVLALWGNKSDMPSHMHTVKQDATQAFLSTYNIPQQLSCKINVLDSSVETAMSTLVQYVDNHLNRVGADVQDNRDLTKLSMNQNSLQQNQSRCCN